MRCGLVESRVRAQPRVFSDRAASWYFRSTPGTALKTWFLVGSLAAFSLGCHSRDEFAVLRFPGSSLATRIDRRPTHLFLAEYDRVLCLERDGRELARRTMFPDSGGYSRTNAHDLGQSKTLLLSAFDAYVPDHDRAEIQPLDRNAAAPRGTHVGAFDTDDDGHWRFIAASERPEASVEPKGGWRCRSSSTT